MTKIYNGPNINEKLCIQGRHGRWNIKYSNRNHKKNDTEKMDINTISDLTNIPVNEINKLISSNA